MKHGGKEVERQTQREQLEMKHLLLAKGLWGLVDGSEVLADDATTAVQALFRLRLQKAFSTIVLVIDSAQLYLITSSEEPKQAWDALRKHFERETLVSKLFLKMQYFRSESDERRPKNSDFEGGEDVYAAAFTASVDSVEYTEKKCCPWAIDSCASSHMTKEKHVMVNFQEFDKPENVALGDGHVLKALGSGSVRMNMLFEATESKKAVLYDVLYVPKLTCNLFSVKPAVAKGNTVEFGPQKCCIKTKPLLSLLYQC